jgi:hypothetical protein
VVVFSSDTFHLVMTVFSSCMYLYFMHIIYGISCSVVLLVA